MNSPPDASDENKSLISEPASFLNGQFIPFSQAKLPLFDAGHVFGATVTDFVRTFRLQLYRLQDHLERFCTSCRLAEIPMTQSVDELTQSAKDLVIRNAPLLREGQELALILIATPGAVPFYTGDSQATFEPTLAMHTAPLDMQRSAALFKTGAQLATPQVRAMPRACIDPRIKHRSRLHWRLAQLEVSRSHPGAHALLLDQDGLITETAAANFLLVRDDTVLSPPLDSVLNGISLAVVRQLCRELGIAFDERPLTLLDCAQAQEAFLTNTSFCLAGVRRINAIDLTWPGPISERILSAWSEKVGIDIRAQFLRSL
jgi:branched-chain amino acid aminotransferase